MFFEREAAGILEYAVQLKLIVVFAVTFRYMQGIYCKFQFVAFTFSGNGPAQYNELQQCGRFAYPESMPAYFR